MQKAKAELEKHVGEIRMVPQVEGKKRHYVAEGECNLLGGYSENAATLRTYSSCRSGWLWRQPPETSAFKRTGVDNRWRRRTPTTPQKLAGMIETAFADPAALAKCAAAALALAKPDATLRLADLVEKLEAQAR